MTDGSEHHLFHCQHDLAGVFILLHERVGGDDLLDVHDPVHHRGQGGGGALKCGDIATFVSK